MLLSDRRRRHGLSFIQDTRSIKKKVEVQVLVWVGWLDFRYQQVPM